MRLQRALLIATTFSVFWTSAATGKNRADRTVSQPTFTVRLQDYTGISAGQMKVAKYTAGKVFKRAGVRIKWLDCTPGHNRPLDSGCEHSFGRTSLVLRILPPAMVSRFDHSSTEVGRALLRADGTGTFASVYSHRVEKLAAERLRTVTMSRVEATLPPGLLLGRTLRYSIAHEVCHLLGNKHSRRGLMHGPWSPIELQQMLRGTLKLTNLGAANVRRQVQKRVANAQGRTVAALRGPSGDR